jgi:hypothetical protein
MEPLPTTGVARFPQGRRFEAHDSDGKLIDVVVSEMQIVSDGDPAKVLIFPHGKGNYQTFVIRLNVVHAFMAHGVQEPPIYSPKTLGHYCQWQIPGAYSTGSEPHAFDVVQGLQGDCRIMSALQVLALQQPQILKKALTIDTSAGTCTIMLRPTPGPKTVCLTTTQPQAFTFSTALPCKFTLGPDKELLFAGTGSLLTYLPLWPSFFEKALAMMWGGYPALTGAEERAFMSTLGFFDISTIQFSQATSGGDQNVEGRIKTITTAFEAKCPMTTFIMGKQHNYGVVGVTAKGVVICDPNSRQDAAFYDRWDHPKIFDGNAETLKNSASFPMFFTWEQYFENFVWIHIFRQ